MVTTRKASSAKIISEPSIPPRRRTGPGRGKRLPRLMEELDLINRPVDDAQLASYDIVDGLTVGGDGLRDVRGRRSRDIIWLESRRKAPWSGINRRLKCSFARVRGRFGRLVIILYGRRRIAVGIHRRS